MMLEAPEGESSKFCDALLSFRGQHFGCTPVLPGTDMVGEDKLRNSALIRYLPLPAAAPFARLARHGDVAVAWVKHLTRSPRRRGRAAWAVLRGRAPWRS